MKLGIDMPSTAMTISRLSCHLWYLKAASAPRAMPPIVEMIRASNPKVERDGEPIGDDLVDSPALVFE
jgi:hypothetical protein